MLPLNLYSSECSRFVKLEVRDNARGDGRNFGRASPVLGVAKGASLTLGQLKNVCMS